jgi:chorismate dehydratase
MHLQPVTGPPLVHWALTATTVSAPLRVSAVSYLNTVPLVWGMLHGPQRGHFDIDFRIPAACAAQLASGEADIGIVPAFELTRQPLDIVPGAGIASHGAVRSILLISRCPAGSIRKLAADSSSRTSVQLARVILARRFGAAPEIVARDPHLETMLADADAALIIGDPALHIDPAALPYHVYDLGALWTELTGRPMVFAVWAARRGLDIAALAPLFVESLRFGRAHMDDIVATEAPARGFAPEFVRDYLTRLIVHELGPAEYDGMREFLRLATAPSAVPAAG